MAKFCPECGVSVSEEQNFCTECRAQLFLQPVEAETKTKKDNLQDKKAFVEKKEDVLGSLETLYHYFNEIDFVYRDLYKSYVKNKNFRGISSGWFMVLSVILTYLAYRQGIINGASGYMILLKSLFLYFIKFFLVLYILGIIYKNYRKHKLKKKIDTRKKEILDHYSQLLKCKLAIEFSDPYIIQALATIYNKGRSETLKETINIYLDDCYKIKSLSEHLKLEEALVYFDKISHKMSRDTMQNIDVEETIALHEKLHSWFS